MMDVISSAKLAISSIYGYGLRRRIGNRSVCDDLQSQGLFIAPSRLDDAVVSRLIEACDRVYTDHPDAVAIESRGSDARIYGVDRLTNDTIFSELQNIFLKDAEIFYGSAKIEQFCMSGDITYRSDGLGSGSGWHRDSPYRHQFKVIVYLTDTTDENGPFEFIPNSHSTASLIGSAQHLSKPLASDRYTTDEIQALLQHGVIDEPLSIVGKAGTIIYADTRGLHRGRPLISGRRRAVTFYIYHNAIPAGFNGVLVKKLQS